MAGVEVLISARDARLLSGDKALDPGRTGKLRGSYPGHQDEADPDGRARRADRLAGGHRPTGPAPATWPSSIRATGRLLRRHVLDAGRRGDLRKAEPEVPAPGAGELRPPPGAPERPRAARAGPGAARARPRQGRRSRPASAMDATIAKKPQRRRPAPAGTRHPLRCRRASDSDTRRRRAAGRPRYPRAPGRDLAAVDLRADGHPAVRAVDLDQLGGRVQAGAPVDHAVRARVHHAC